MGSEDLNKVWEIKSLKQPGQDGAKTILEKISKQVQPIMRKHNWRVKILSEFCPKNPTLLGLNIGAGLQVKLRLRRPNNNLDFFPFDQILDTMLHELCHNAHGPHNTNFYKLWDELRKECEDLMANGITGTGEGFDLPGKRLGGFSCQPPISSLRKTALTAAENRARLSSILPSGPKRLGGDNTIMVALSPIQAAAMAAERRSQDDIWCGSQAIEEFVELESSSTSHSSVTIPRKRTRNMDNPSSQNVNGHLKSDFVYLSDGNLTSTMFNHGMNSGKRNDVVTQSSNLRSSFVDPTTVSLNTCSIRIHDATGNENKSATWECGTCTLMNPPLAPICELCSTEKPKDEQSKYKFWSCKFCTLENVKMLDKCLACGQWRYSNGQPVSTPSPNLGT